MCGEVVWLAPQTLMGLAGPLGRRELEATRTAQVS